MSDKIYEVKSGDSISRIAQRSGVSAEKIKSMNIGTGKRKGSYNYEDRQPAWGLNVGDIIILPSESKVGDDINSEKGKDIIKDASKTGRLDSYKQNNANAKFKEDSKTTSIEHAKATTDCPYCKLDKITVKCQHGDRAYTATFIAESQDVVFEVMAGTKGDKLTVDLIGEGCKKSKSDCPAVKVAGQETLTKTDKEITVYGKEISIIDNDFSFFLKNVLFPKALYEEYDLVSKTCDAHGQIKGKVKAYTPVSWEGKLAVGYFHPVDGRTDKRMIKPGYWSAEGGISVSFDNKKLELGSPKAKGKLKKKNVQNIPYQNMTKALDQLFGIIARIPKSVNRNFTAKVFWPKIVVSGKVGSVEVTNSPYVGIAGDISLGFKPFFGAEIQADILGVLIDILSKGHPVIALIKKALKYANESKSIEAVVEIILKLSGKIDGELKWHLGDKTSPTLPTNTIIPKGKVSASLELSLEGNAKITVDTFLFTCFSGVSMGAKTGLSVHAMPGWEQEPTIAFQTSFDGVTVYYVAYTGAGRPDVKTKVLKKRPKDSEQQKTSVKHTKNNVLIEPAKWPEKPIPVPLPYFK